LLEWRGLTQYTELYLICPYCLNDTSEHCTVVYTLIGLPGKDLKVNIVVRDSKVILLSM